MLGSFWTVIGIIALIAFRFDAWKHRCAQERIVDLLEELVHQSKNRSGGPERSK